MKAKDALRDERRKDGHPTKFGALTLAAQKALEALREYEGSPDYYEATAHQNALVGIAREALAMGLEGKA